MLAMLPICGAAAATKHFDPDTDLSRINWSNLQAALGPIPTQHGARFGAVLKTQSNGYWRLIANGYRKKAKDDGVKIDIQAAQSETDSVEQLAIMESMLGGLYKGILVSPMSDSNLQTAIDDASLAKINVIDVDGAVVDGISHFVGAVNREMGVRVANWFIKTYPQGGKLGVVVGQAGVYSTVKRTAGFLETLALHPKFEVVAVVPGDWDRQKAYDAAVALMTNTPDLIGFYCNNDIMALGVVDAIRALHRSTKVKVFGTDGTRAAYESIKADGLTGTVDIFPFLTAQIGLEVAERLAAGQDVPRVVETVQLLVTKENISGFGPLRPTSP